MEVDLYGVCLSWLHFFSLSLFMPSTSQSCHFQGMSYFTALTYPDEVPASNFPFK